ncbi:MAG TPA: VOC family protein [Candidatus Intestinimonas pullistercoris]|uniref:VOC family protein n=1 Tax=Candidatus Intestinimonas pullistercoris TaxID=2838623 RepID=A0A9D2T095_9FIRM|nr:VOC family protein [uncultured Intestinimonas sp.]HJC41697.1 VOC family protein [Candidatus Intestinimonas pullistercoris]
MRPMRMHHVGVVLPTVEQAERLIQLFGLKVDYRGYVKSYHADLIFTQYGPNESPIEFIIPHEGVLTKFNNGKGGIAHIAFEVEDVEAASRELEEQGLEMLEKAPVEGTSDIIVNFLRPRYSEGILFELVQTVGPIDRSGGDPARE